MKNLVFTITAMNVWLYQICWYLNSPVLNLFQDIEFLIPWSSHCFSTVKPGDSLYQCHLDLWYSIGKIFEGDLLVKISSQYFLKIVFVKEKSPTYNLKKFTKHVISDSNCTNFRQS